MKLSGLVSADARWPVSFFVIALAITVAGFWPSFFGVLAEVTRTDLLHGWSATGWLCLTVIQAALIGGDRRGVHRALGYLSVALALLVVFTGFGAVQNQTMRTLDETQRYLFMFNVSNLLQLTTFTVFLGLGIVAARRGAITHHMRFMMGTSLIVLPPPFERLWVNWAPALVPDYDVAFYASLLTVELILATLVIVEWRRGRIYPQFPAIMALFALILLIAKPVAEAPWFQSFSYWFAGA